MKNEKNLQSNLLMELGNHKPLIMDLGDNVLLHMKWNEKENIYEDEMGATTMDLILKIINGEVEIKGKKVEIRIED